MLQAFLKLLGALLAFGSFCSMAMSLAKGGYSLTFFGSWDLLKSPKSCAVQANQYLNRLPHEFMFQGIHLTCDPVYTCALMSASMHVKTEEYFRLVSWFV